MKPYMFRTVPLSIIRSFHCTHSKGVCYKSLLTACEQDQAAVWSCSQMSANLYNIYHCCVYSAIHLMMDRGNVRNI